VDAIPAPGDFFWGGCWKYENFIFTLFFKVLSFYQDRGTLGPPEYWRVKLILEAH
jgi:hypothetical protein